MNNMGVECWTAIIPYRISATFVKCMVIGNRCTGWNKGSIINWNWSSVIDPETQNNVAAKLWDGHLFLNNWNLKEKIISYKQNFLCIRHQINYFGNPHVPQNSWHSKLNHRHGKHWQWTVQSRDFLIFLSVLNTKRKLWENEYMAVKLSYQTESQTRKAEQQQ